MAIQNQKEGWATVSGRFVRLWDRAKNPLHRYSIGLSRWGIDSAGTLHLHPAHAGERFQVREDLLYHVLSLETDIQVQP